MTAMLMVVAALQGNGWTYAPVAPTVGDTIRIERSIPVPPGAGARTGTLAADDLLEPLAQPEIAARRGAVLVRHRVAVFAPGAHRIAMPSIELIAPDGQVDVVAGDTAAIVVASVLPDSAERPLPQASLAPIGRPVRRLEPLLALVGAVTLLIGTWGVTRRRARARTASVVGAPDVVEPPVMQWLAAGEGRAAATLAAGRLRERIAATVPEAIARGRGIAECIAIVRAERPDWPLDELEDVLRALERARFAPLVPVDAVALADRTEVLLDHLVAEPPGDEPQDGS